MNPLGSLPGTSSEQFSLNALDWKKILRAALIQLGGVFVTVIAPHLLGLTYTWGGVSYTPYVLIAVNAALEMVRRWLSSAPKV
jgi:hypothetical protein